MSRSTPGGLGFSISMASSARQQARASDAPLHVLVAADCSGRAARGICEPLAGRSARRLDVARQEAVFAAWGAQLPSAAQLLSGQAVSLAPRDLDDLHPDQLLQNVAELRELRELRDRLESHPEAAARLAALLGAPPVEAAAAPSSPAPGALESGPQTLSRLLGATPAAAAERAARESPRPGVDVNGFIQKLIGDASPRGPVTRADTAALRVAADRELSRALRSLLSDSSFRSLEATWRGIDGLCRNCPDEESVQHSVLDASAPELLADLPALGALLEAQAPSLLLLDHYFGPHPEELRALTQLLGVCTRHGVMLIAGAHPLLAGCNDFAERANPDDQEHVASEAARGAWAELAQARSEGARLGLALPRFLLRQPYGSSGEPLELLAFEELGGATDHEAFCWGNGAYLLARALCHVHAGASGVNPDGSVDLRELPVVHLESDAGIRIKPCAEAWLSERAVGRLRAAGFCVLQGIKDTDRIRVHA